MSQDASLMDDIFDVLSTKSQYKQDTYQNIIQHYEVLKGVLRNMQQALSARLKTVAPEVKVVYKEPNEFEAHLQFGGDVLVFTMHSNVFAFAEDHVIYKSPYVIDDPTRAYCGMINIYNFLADSYRYQRYNDVGYLIGRIFINRDHHFFVDGNKRLMFLFSDFGSLVMDEVAMGRIVENAIQFSVDFDLYAPPFDAVREITLVEKLAENAYSGIRTGKRIGFDLSILNEDGSE